MGPVRSQGEAVSSYRFRYARYSLKWLAFLGSGLVALLILRPWSDSGAELGLLFFLYIGISLGALAAVLAALGFLIGGLWSRRLEGSAPAARAWVRTKLVVISVVSILVAGFAIYWTFIGMTTGETLALSRKGVRVSHAQDAFRYLVAMAFWIFASVSAPVAAWKNLRVARAT